MHQRAATTESERKGLKSLIRAFPMFIHPTFIKLLHVRNRNKDSKTGWLQQENCGITREVKCMQWGLSGSAVSDSLWSHGLQPARLCYPWDSPSKNTGVGSQSFLQGIFPNQGLNPVSFISGGLFTSWATGKPNVCTGRYNTSSTRRPQFDCWVRKAHWRRDRLPTPVFLGFPVAQLVKNPPIMRGTWVWSPEKGKATHSSFLAWIIPRTV